MKPKNDPRPRVTADSRGRILLGKHAGDNKYFLVTVEEDGRIILDPAVLVNAVTGKLIEES